MNCLLSLLIWSWMKESREMKPLGDRSVLELMFSRKAMIVSPRPLPPGQVNKSTVFLVLRFSRIIFCEILLSKLNG